MSKKKAWAEKEKYENGSPEAERLIFAALARDLLDVQVANKKRGKSSETLRAFHAKTTLGVTNAKLEILPELPDPFNVGFFRAGSRCKASVRFSNASGLKRADYL